MLLVPPVSGGQLLAQCLRYRLYPYLRASKRIDIIYKQSSGVCASLLVLLEYVTFWVNQCFKCWGKPPFTLGSSSKCFFYLLLLQGACQNVFLASLCSRELVKTFFLPPFTLGDLSKCFFYLPLLQGTCQNVFFTSFCSRGLVKMFFLPPFALGSLSKCFFCLPLLQGACQKSLEIVLGLFSLCGATVFTFLLPFFGRPDNTSIIIFMFSGAPTMLQQLFLCFRAPRRCFNNYFYAFGRPDNISIIIFVLSGLPTVFKYFVYLGGVTAFTFLLPFFSHLHPCKGD